MRGEQPYGRIKGTCIVSVAILSVVVVAVVVVAREVVVLLLLILLLLLSAEINFFLNDRGRRQSGDRLGRGGGGGSGRCMGDPSVLGL